MYSVGVETRDSLCVKYFRKFLLVGQREDKWTVNQVFCKKLTSRSPSFRTKSMILHTIFIESGVGLSIWLFKLIEMCWSEAWNEVHVAKHSCIHFLMGMAWKIQVLQILCFSTQLELFKMIKKEWRWMARAVYRIYQNWKIHTKYFLENLGKMGKSFIKNRSSAI
jgi:hypothetical protein